MAETTSTTEATETEKLDFFDRLKIYNASIVPVAAPTDTAPGRYKFKDGVTKESLQKAMGYPKTQAYTVGLKAMQDYTRYCTMKVEYNGEPVYGQKLQELCDLSSRQKFVDFCESNLADDCENPKIKLIVDGVSLPTFTGRTTKKPDILSMMGLIADIQPDTEDE